MGRTREFSPVKFREEYFMIMMYLAPMFYSGICSCRSYIYYPIVQSNPQSSSSASDYLYDITMTTVDRQRAAIPYLLLLLLRIHVYQVSKNLLPPVSISRSPKGPIVASIRYRKNRVGPRNETIHTDLDQPTDHR